jgi:hypothetical protein
VVEDVIVQADDDEALIQSINRIADAGLTRVGRAEHGTSGGAIMVELRDGRSGVVTRFVGRIEDAQRTSTVLDHARSRGLPVPRHHLVLEVDDAVMVVQERLPGAPGTEASTAMVDTIVALNERFANVLDDRLDVPILPMCLDVSGDPAPRHEVLAAYGDRSRRILAAIRDTGIRGPNAMTGNDLVHIDLIPDNILFDEHGVVIGVVDWNLGAYRGDRWLALVKTRFEQEWSLHAPTPRPSDIAAAAHLDAILVDHVPPATLRMYWAHRLLSQLHWILQAGPPETINWHLDVAEQLLL